MHSHLKKGLHLHHHLISSAPLEVEVSYTKHNHAMFHCCSATRVVLTAEASVA
jgi:hypothetical protein